MFSVRFKHAAPGLALAFLLLGGCGRPWGRQEPLAPAKHLATPPEELSGLSETEYLKRKATLGSRSERLEALDVIDRTGDPELLPFLLDRLEKEEDDLLRVRIMSCLARQQDVRAVVPLRQIARRQTNRVGIEAVVSLYELGDDSYVPKLIRIMRETDLYPELSGVAHRTLKRLYEVELPANPRAWNTYYRSHRLAPYQSLKWYASFSAPLPPTVAGTTKVVPRPKGGPQLPQEETKLRRHIVTVFEFWKPDEP
jgi:hypothetical protein